MRIVKKISGTFLYMLAKVIFVIINGLIKLTENIVFFAGKFFKGCLALMSMGGCLFLILFANVGFRILMHPVGFTIVLLLFTFFLFGGRFVSHLKYLKYIITEFLFNTANYLSDSEKYTYKTFNQYKEAYRKAEEEKIKQEQHRYYEQQRQWQERFRQQWYEQNYYSGQGNYNDYSSGGYANTNLDFKNNYEKSCDILGVPYNSDKNKIKSAYRRKAKEYHPDLSKVPNATKRFQEINAAYEFLNDDNIQRYKNIS
ncbi:DnaJ domain-containing protein [Herbivorax sp. ANBcel31]|uniref:DnaJ domain-containing protein n=1 Tax=Herbivorax sp. ANBcel31 TaxID=3069754 RepID=UPI0027B258A9|nr:DnaJ domain-containing protein [Herbivorax sp. ANBcel31]MDQ2085532.1 DnaJ domain-containing protein [Herbivorax sp. ANBcel31]